MNEIQFINHDLFEELFPFYFCVDRQLSIADMGKSLKKIIPSCNIFKETFKFIRPGLGIKYEFDSIFEFKGQVFILQIKEHPDSLRLKGQFIYTQHLDRLIFCGSPWITTEEVLLKSNILINDFALHDTLVDMIQVNKALELENIDKNLLNKEIENQKQFLDSLMNCMPVDIAVFDEDLRYSYLNKSAIKNDELRQWMIGKRFIDYYEYRKLNLDLAKEREDLLRTSLNEQKQYNFTDTYNENTENEKVILRESFPFKDSKGKKYLLGYGVDITPIKKTNDQLAKKNEELNELNKALDETKIDLELMIDSTHEIIQKISPEGRLTFVNKAWLTNFGYSLEEVNDMLVFDLIAPESKESCSVTFHQLMNGHAVDNMEITFIRKDGERIFMRGYALPRFKNGIVVGSETFFMNITEKVKSEQQFRDLVESAPDAMIISDINGKIKVANAQSEKLFNYSKEELLEMPIMNIVPDSYKSSQIKILEAFFTQEKSETNTLEFMGKKKDGSEFPAEISLSPIKTNDGFLICAAIRDISERIKVQRELNEKYEELKKTNDELDRFVYSTSHDLRSPLTSLLGLISIVNDNLPEDDEQQKLRVEMMERSVKKLDSFIGDILDYSRNNRMELAVEEISFENMVRETCDRHKYMLGAGGSEMKINVVQDDKFYSDSRRLAVIFNNLISNALKYQDKSKQHTLVNIDIATTPKNASISIEDNGIGIDTKDHQKIFEMFYRATKTSTGSGLGLYIVKEAVEKLNGKISIESEQGKGSKFIVDIPNLFDKL